MILRKNQDLFNLIKALAGVNQFTTNEVTSLLNFTNRRLTTAYDTSVVWTRYIVPSEERKVSSFTVSGITDSDEYNIPYTKYGDFTHTGTKVSDAFVPNNQSASSQTTTIFYKNSSSKWVWGLATYSKTTADVVTITPSTVFATQQDADEFESPSEVLDWGTLGTRTGNLVVTNSSTITYEETFDVLSSATTRVSKTSIASFIRVHRKQAFLNDSSTEYDFFVDSNGANILNSSITDSTAFVTYKKHIIDTSTGLVISSLDTDGSASLQQIPLEFFQYTAHAVYADFLRLDGQTDKAFVEEQKATEFLVEELEKVDIINNRNSLNQKFSTYINTSSR